jgi:hypothetical protein
MKLSSRRWVLAALILASECGHTSRFSMRRSGGREGRAFLLEFRL